MKKAKSILSILTATLLIAALFVGCGTNNNNSSSESSGSSSSSSGSSSNSDSSSSIATVPMKDVVTKIYQEKMDGSDDWLDDVDKTAFTETYDMNFDVFDDFYGKVPKTMIHASSIIGGHVKDGKVADAKAELQKYQDQVKKNFEQYLPDQYDIAKNGVIFEEGNYVFLVMYEDVDTIREAIQAELK